MNKLAILGASGHGKVIADAALAAGWKDVIFFDDDFPQKKTNGAWPIVGITQDLLASHKSYGGVVVGIGECATRWNKHCLLKKGGAKIVSIIHPHACVSSFAQIGAGSVVFAGAVINVGSVLGEACIVNTGATVDHDVVLTEAVHVAPNVSISGNVNVGARSWIGVGAVVRQSITIGSDVMVGAGAIVVKDIPDNIAVIGNPARIYERG